MQIHRVVIKPRDRKVEEGWVNKSTHATTKYVLAPSNSSRVNQGTSSFCPLKLSLHNAISDFKLLAEGSNAAASGAAGEYLHQQTTLPKKCCSHRRWLEFVLLPIFLFCFKWEGYKPIHLVRMSDGSL